MYTWQQHKKKTLNAGKTITGLDDSLIFSIKSMILKMLILCHSDLKLYFGTFFQKTLTLIGLTSKDFIQTAAGLLMINNFSTSYSSENTGLRLCRTKSKIFRFC